MAFGDAGTAIREMELSTISDVQAEHGVRAVIAYIEERP
jgi:hypothetical protein